ncbi:GNAT family N-acetyltransferase [Methanocalculus sp. MC3]
MNIEPDSWLSSVMGYPVFRVTETDILSDISSDKLLAEINNDRAFFFAKVPVSRLDVVHKLCKIGFGIIDVNVIFERKPYKEYVESNSKITIRKYQKKDQDAVLRIAGSCFKYSRFHLDPLIPNKLADHIKREWILNYINGSRGNDLFVAEFEGKPIGFNAVLDGVQGSERIRIIDLIGVDTAFQRLGVGRKLIDCFIHDSHENYSILRVGSQIVNIPAIRLYNCLNFFVSEASYVLHAHCRNGEMIQ